MQTRRTFMNRVLSCLAITGMAFVFPGCGRDTGNSPSAAAKINCSTDLHPHNCTSFDPDEMVPVNVTLTGGHTHSVTLTISDLGQLAEVGNSITKNSTGGDHVHRVTFTRIAA